jgi:hypothetical protein
MKSTLTVFLNHPTSRIVTIKDRRVVRVVILGNIHGWFSQETVLSGPEMLTQQTSDIREGPIHFNNDKSRGLWSNQYDGPVRSFLIHKNVKALTEGL